MVVPPMLRCHDSKDPFTLRLRLSNRAGQGWHLLWRTVAMKRRYWLVLTVLAGAVIGVLSLLVIVNIVLFPTVPWPHSDIPITCELGSWPYQGGLTITELTAEAVRPQLNLFNDRFLIRYRLKGAVKAQVGWKPRIGQAQITGRLVSNRQNQEPAVADVLIVPIVEVTRDAGYTGELVRFDVKLEQITSTMDWGTNEYDVRCLDHNASVTVHQYK